MEDFRLAGVWKDTLVKKHWSFRALSQIKFAWAQSTLKQYDSVCKKLVKFCNSNGYDFPPLQSNVIADFLCYIADSSSKPRSGLNTATASIGNLYSAFGLPNVCANKEILLLVQGLVKAGTTAPMSFSKAMPIGKFHDLFSQWPDNGYLSLKDLRLKSITLLALTAMLRPSDIAPKAQVFDPTTGVASSVVFSIGNITFDAEGMNIVFFGIKNDTQRTGFEVYIPRGVDEKLDPVSVLELYIYVTEPARPAGGAVFLSLKHPFEALNSIGVASVLRESISLAGLEGQGYTPKDFRPTGATGAIACGIDPGVARKVGRWKSEEVFFSRYVHHKPPKGYSDTLLSGDM